MSVKLIALALGTAACGGGASTAAGGQTSPQKLIDAAQKEGTMTWYRGSTEKCFSAAAEKFEATYGIKVNVARLISAQIA